jgi:methionine biosynthesis protein MetW
MQMRDYLTKYDNLASEDKLFQIPLKKEYFLSRIGKGKRVLDAGCLGGKISRLVLDQNNEVFGVELNPSAASVAKQRGIQVKTANIEDGLPYADSFFDVVMAGELLEHLYDTKFFFQESHRVLNEGGIFLFTTPNLNSWENRIQVAKGGYLSMTGAYPEDHFGERVRIFNLAKIQEICDQTGFEIENVSGIPLMTSFGKTIDLSMGVLGKFFPSFSKLFMVTARKIDAKF